MKPLISLLPHNTRIHCIFALTPHHHHHHHILLRRINMSAATPTPQPKKSPAIPKGKTELKILMLHGYTQSGGLFSSKTKALSKQLAKALGPAPYNLHPTLIFPTAPLRLRPSDIPGYVPADDGGDAEDEGDSWAWFRKDEATGAYRGFEDGMLAIASAIAEAGGVDGVCGFSQGGAMAALVASALEKPYRSPSSPSSSEQSDNAASSWLPALRAANNSAPLKFCVVYSGFYAPPPELRWLYAPPIATPSLHFLGSLDTVVEESRSRALVDRCLDPAVVVHPGGHYVPVAKDWVLVLVGWLRKRYDPGTAEKKKKEEENL